MAFAAKALGDGQLSDSQAAIYTCPLNTVAYVKSITLFNTGASIETVILWINRSGTPRKWRQYIFGANEHADVLGGASSIILEAGDTIEAMTTTAGTVDYTISGVEET